jgi:hypothetical protein
MECFPMFRVSTALVFASSLSLFLIGCTDPEETLVYGNGDPTSGEGTGTGDCSFTSKVQLSPKIGTVAIVTWTTTLSDVQSAHIEFGLTMSYGMIAPVDLKDTDYRTLLLGMKPMTTYHYRVVAANSSSECTSPDYKITAGPLLNGLPSITVSTTSIASPIFGGFLITGQYLQIPKKGAPAYIIDADGTVVWAFTSIKDVTGARMSHNGKYMWINSANVPSYQGAAVHRVSMDGLSSEDLSIQFVGLNHQLAVLPDETVAFYAYGSNNCDDIKEYSPTAQSVRTIVNAGTAQGGVTACHLNNIQYSSEDDALVFSDLDNQVVVKIRRSDGKTLWVLNGPNATLTGVTWGGSQHGIHILGQDRFVLFNNNNRIIAGGVAGAGGSSDGSSVLEISLDLVAKKATQVWSYKAYPGIQNDVMGDMQRLPNGNTIIGYSTKGVVHEVNAEGTLLQQWTWPLGASFGYIEKRASLYGPPLR